MNTCGTCKHLGPAVVERDPDGEFETNCKGALPPVLATEAGLNYHVCTLIKQVYQDKPGAAVPIDGSGYFAALCVSDEFGCNQWSPRE